MLKEDQDDGRDAMAAMKAMSLKVSEPGRICAMYRASISMVATLANSLGCKLPTPGCAATPCCR